MYKNTIIIVFIIALLAFGGYLFFNKEEEDVTTLLTNPVTKTPDILPYGNGEPTNWGDFATAIKNKINAPSGTQEPVAKYTEIVDGVRGFFKGANVQLTGMNINRYDVQIEEYLVNDGRVYYDSTLQLGELL